jgi:hypothetical protein
VRHIIELMAKGKWFAEALQQFQAIVPLGLGDTFADVVACGAVAQELSVLEGHPRGELLEQDCYLMHGLSRWHRGGAPRFRLTHSFATQLALTDPDGLDGTEVELPFGTFLIELPFPRGPLVFDAVDSPRDAVCILVNVTYGNATAFDLPHGTADQIARDLLAAKEMCVWDKKSIRMIVISDLVHEDSRYIDHPIFIGDSVNLAEQGHLINMTGRDRRCCLLASRLVVNLALSLKYRPSAPGEGGRTVHDDHGLDSILYELGRDVKIDSRMRAGARAFCLAGSRPQEWELAKRFVVRGHWKQQPHGPGRSERKMIFVEPYWKGPADAPAVSHAYCMDTPRTKENADG